jgi:hypothetical protein
VRFFEVSSGFVNDSLDLSFINSFGNKLVSVLISSASHSRYDLVHKRLSETRVIEFIVSHFAVSN